MCACRSVCQTGQSAKTGAPLSPFLFPLYTPDLSDQTESCHLQRFSDDSAIDSVSNGNDAEDRTVCNSVAWCEQNHLQLNVTMTKELIVDLRRVRTLVNPVYIQGDTMDIVEDYKYLGMFIDHKPSWAKNTDAIYKKARTSSIFLKGLRSFDI